MGLRARLLTYLVILCSLALGALGQVLLKSGASTLDAQGPGVFSAVLEGLRQPMVVLGLLAYVVSSGLWLVVLSRVQLSVAYPLAAVNHVLVAVGAVALGESLPPARWLGVALVASGVALLGFSDLRGAAVRGRRSDPREGSAA